MQAIAATATLPQSNPTQNSMPKRYNIGGHDGRPLFGEKVAQNLNNVYDERTKENCMEATRNYLISKRWEMENLLNWAENYQRREIHIEDV